MKKQLFSVVTAVFLSVCLCVSAFAKSDEIKVRRVEITPDKVTVRVNQTRTLLEYVYPTDADDQSITWSSSNEDIVLVDQDGVITGVSPGTATVSATSVNGRVGTCTVTVPSYVLNGIEQDVTNKDFPGSVVDGGETLSAATVKAAVDEQVRAAAKGTTATVTFYDKTEISDAAVRAARFTAEAAGGSVLLRFDTTDGSESMLFGQNTAPVEGRLTLDPKKAGDLTQPIATAVYTRAGKTQSVRDTFSTYYSNNFAVIACGQQGSYGCSVTIAAKPDLSALDTTKLRLYSYNSTDNTVRELTSATYSIDANGYIHITTDTGGAILLTDGALNAR